VAGRCNASQDAQDAWDATLTDQTQGPFLLMKVESYCKLLKYRKVLRWLREDHISWSDFFSFFLNHLFIVKVQELACIVRFGIKKTLIPTTARLTSSWEKSNTPNL